MEPVPLDVSAVKLPTRQLNITILFPFIVFFVARTLHDDVESPHVNYMAGFVAAAFPIGQFISGLVIGHLSDVTQRRRPFIIVGLVCNVFLYPPFGFLDTLNYGLVLAVILRLVQGILNSNIGICRAAISETCQRRAASLVAAHRRTHVQYGTGGSMHSTGFGDDQKHVHVHNDDQELIAVVTGALARRAFAYLSVVFPMGLALGSIIGGGLSNPVDLGLDTELLRMHPYLLPCLVSSLISLIATIFAVAGIDETYMLKKVRGKQVRGASSASDVDERAPLLGAPKQKTHWQALRELSQQTYVLATLNFVMGFCFNGFAEVFPLWAKSPVYREGSSVASGLAFGAAGIGLAHALAGIVSAPYQFFLYGKVVKAMRGVLPVFKLSVMFTIIVCAGFPLLAFAAPTGVAALWTTISLAQAVKALAFSSAFTSLYIMISRASTAGADATNAGLVNGLAQSAENLGKALSPALMGLAFAASQAYKEPAYPFLSFWILTTMCCVALALAYFLQGESVDDPRMVAAVQRQNQQRHVDAQRRRAALASSGAASIASEADQYATAKLADLVRAELEYESSDDDDSELEGDDDEQRVDENGQRSDGSIGQVLPPAGSSIQMPDTLDEGVNVKAFRTGLPPARRQHHRVRRLVCGVCVAPTHERTCVFYGVNNVPSVKLVSDLGESAYGSSYMPDVESAAEAVASSARRSGALPHRPADTGAAYASTTLSALHSIGSLPSAGAAQFLTAPNLGASEAVKPRDSVKGVRVDTSGVPQTEIERTVEKFLNHFNGSLRLVVDNDQFEVQGRAYLRRVVLRFVARNEPIDMCLPAFPCKSPNANDKVLGILPDYGEEFALRRLDDFCEEVRKYYAPGAKLCVMSDGRVFADLVGVPDAHVNLYRTELVQLGEWRHIRFDRLDNYVHQLDANVDDSQFAEKGLLGPRECTTDPDEVRRRLIEKYAPSEEQVDDDVKNDAASWMVYRGFIRFLEKDRVWDRSIYTSRTKIKKECARIARQMMRRNKAFSHLVELNYPHVVRISIHGHNNAGPKFGVRLLPELTRAQTPWHNCAVVFHTPREHVLLMQREDCEKMGDRLKLVEKNGRPYYFEEVV